MASGDTLCVFKPQHNQPPASNYATLDTRNGHVVLDFDASTEEAAYFAGILPHNYAGGGLNVYVHWMATSATSGNVKWGGSLEAHDAGGTDLDSDSFAAEQTQTGAAQATSGQVTQTTISFTDGAQIDSLTGGLSFRFKLARKAADAADTMTGDAELLGIEIRET